MKRAIVFLLLFGLTCTGYAQPKFIKKLLFEKDSTRKGRFIALPSIGYSQETGLDFGANALYSFYADTIYQETRISNLYASVSYTTKGQSRMALKSDYWSSKNRYHLTGKIGYTNFPFNFYGIGNKTLNSDQDIIIQKNLYLIAGVEKLLAKHFYGGLNIELNKYSFIDKVNGGIFANADLDGRNGGTTLQYGPSVIYDTRNINTYTTHGVYLKANGGVATSLGNRSYRGSYLKIDARQFNSLSKKLVLAFNMHYRTLGGENVPFFLMYNFGNDEMMRGYYNGRYKDQNLIALQSELRFRFADRFGIVAFGGTGTVYAHEFKPGELKPNYGGGLRYFFDPKKGLSARIDYGIGEKRPNEKRQSGLYLSLSESF